MHAKHNSKSLAPNVLPIHLMGNSCKCCFVFLLLLFLEGKGTGSRDSDFVSEKMCLEALRI